MKNPRSYAVVALIVVALVAAAAARLWPRPPLAAQIHSSSAYFDRNHELLRLTLAADDRYRLWLPLEELPPLLVDAMLEREDRWFHWHPGVNPVALVRGGWRTYVGGEPRQGGSTITMQLARLLYRLNTRTVGGKLRQMALAVQLELKYSKHDLLEAYLNLLPYGRNVEGAGAASLIWFGKPAAALSPPEILALAVIPQHPARRGQVTMGRAAQSARERLYVALSATHPDLGRYAATMRLPLAVRRLDQLPFRAPHLVDQLRRAEREPREVVTTLDLELQSALERQLKGYVAQHASAGLRNAVAMLLDHRTMEVRALVGSAAYFDRGIAGQVNGTQGKRSPGSTLKPFLYALALDQGLIHPLTMLSDAPLSYSDYAPENFDGRFLGPVTARDALIRSRNVPAIALAARLRQPTLYEFLKSAHLSRLASEQHYGLALVLGGGEVTMAELVTLYAMLANGGRWQPLRFQSAPSDAPATLPFESLLSPEAAFLTLDMLRSNPEPDETPGASARFGPVAWKTGTSWGFRDAWAVGVAGPYVLAVWLGNFDGRSNPALIGARAAAPLFFQMLTALQEATREPADWLTPPPGVTQVPVCLPTGDLPNAWCPRLGTTWFIPGRSPIRVSNVHRPLVIDTRTGSPACGPVPPRYARTEVFEYWPSDMLKVFREAGVPRRSPPVAPASCRQGQATLAGAAPRITSPAALATYALRLQARNEQAVPLAATVDADAQALYWFSEDVFLGRAPAEGPLLWIPPRRGRYLLRAIDDRGRAAAREVDIEMLAR